MGQQRQIDVAGQKIAARQFLSLTCLAITLTAGLILKEDKKPSLVGGERVWEAFQETIWARVVASQKLLRDSGETIFAARHQSVSQGVLTTKAPTKRPTNPEGPARHLDASRQKLSPHCREAIFDSQLPSPKFPLKMPPELPLPHKRGLFFFSKIAPAVRVIAWQLSGKNCLAAILASQHQDASQGPLGRRPRKCPRKCPLKWSRFTCPVFACSVLHQRQP